MTFNYCCEQQGRCGVTLFELLLRAAETLRCHVLFELLLRAAETLRRHDLLTADASSRDIATS